MRSLLLLLLLSSCVPLPAQDRKVIDLRADYGLTEMQSKVLIKNLFTSQASAQAKYPKAWQDWQARGKSAAAFMSLSAADAALSDAVWRGVNRADLFGKFPDSNNPVVLPAGTYALTVRAIASAGKWSGQGSGYTDVNNTSTNTRLIPYHEQWQGDPSERVLVIVGPWGNVGQWTFGGGLSKMSLDGAPESNPGRVRTVGIRAWASTETQAYDDLVVTRFNVGVEVFNPTPTRFGLLSISGNTEAGLRCVGGWGSTVQIDVLSGDDNGKMFEQVEGFGYAAGGSVSIDVVKNENGGWSVATFGPHRANTIELSGSSRMNIGALWYHTGPGIKVDAVFVVRNTGNPILLNVGVYGTTSGVANLVHQLKTASTVGRAWSNANRLQGAGLVYDSQEGGGSVRVNSTAQSFAVRYCTEPLGWTVGTTTYPSATSCTPAYKVVGY